MIPIVIENHTEQATVQLTTSDLLRALGYDPEVYRCAYVKLPGYAKAHGFTIALYLERKLTS